jgi:hypothetical protein
VRRWLVPVVIGILAAAALAVSRVFAADDVRLWWVALAMVLAFLTGSSTAARMARRW